MSSMVWSKTLKTISATLGLLIAMFTLNSLFNQGQEAVYNAKGVEANRVSIEEMRRELISKIMEELDKK